tara:strand:- start:1416 stop:2201 length:786 start_codon:yes stop_codon:yes gene_type:complete
MTAMYKKTYGKRTKNLFDPKSEDAFKISRSKIDDFTLCPRCFYLDRRLGVGKPSMPGFTLNIAVDELLKKEFDVHRVRGEKHPLMETYGIDAIPFEHKDLDKWRENFVGVQALHKPTNLLIFGAVDDVWVNSAGELIVVDYKATSKRGEINLDEGWGPHYKRQLEVYQWLLRQNGFSVSDIGYFVYCNGDKDKEAFDAQLEFNVEVIAHTGRASWVDDTLIELKKTLLGDLPPLNKNCEYCMYRKESQEIEKRDTKQPKLF